MLIKAIQAMAILTLLESHFSDMMYCSKHAVSAKHNALKYVLTSVNAC